MCGVRTVHGVSSLFPSMWVGGLELKSLGLAVSTLSYGAILMAFILFQAANFCYFFLFSHLIYLNI